MLQLGNFYHIFVKKKMIELLTNAGLFINMKTEEKEECLVRFHYQIKQYQKGEIISYTDDQVIQQIILLRGSVKNEMSDYNGKFIKITDMEAPKLLAPGFLFGSQCHYPVSIFASSDCEIMAINKSDFLDTLLSNNQLQLNFLNLISNQTQFLTRKIQFLKLKTIKAKIAHFLLNLNSRQDSLTVNLPQSQTQLAELFGITRPSLSRSINELCHDSIIKTSGKKVIILDINKLKSFLY
jgi:CRP-like cAMP-binding protein